MSDWNSENGNGRWRESTRIRFGFRGKNQLPLFMLWREYLNETGEVVYAAVIFQIRGYALPRASSMDYGGGPFNEDGIEGPNAVPQRGPEKCDRCYGSGYVDGGQTPWRCSSCNGTGAAPKGDEV